MSSPMVDLVLVHSEDAFEVLEIRVDNRLAGQVLIRYERTSTEVKALVRHEQLDPPAGYLEALHRALCTEIAVFVMGRGSGAQDVSGGVVYGDGHGGYRPFPTPYALGLGYPNSA